MSVLLSKRSLLLIVIIMLYFGIRFKGYESENNISWSEENSGLKFMNSSLAFTKKDFFLPLLQDNTFAIELMIEPIYQKQPRFSFILLVLGNNELNQFLLGQWDSSLVLMNGSDYSHYYQQPKIFIPLDKELKKVKVLISSSIGGTSVYLDDKLMAYSEKLILSLPASKDFSRVILGNNINGLNPWEGTLHYLSFYNETISPASKPYYHYDFKSINDNHISESMGRGLDILFPEKKPNLKKKFLSWPKLKESSKRIMVFDMVINFLGFIPLGISLSVFIYNRKKSYSGKYILISFISIVLFSLLIELIQVKIPSRDSSLLDWLLNSSGGLAGIFLLKLIKYFGCKCKYS